jgi:hypothetical protein
MIHSGMATAPNNRRETGKINFTGKKGSAETLDLRKKAGTRPA